MRLLWLWGVAVRLGQFDYLPTYFSKTTQNNFRYSTGVVLRLEASSADEPDEDREHVVPKRWDVSGRAPTSHWFVPQRYALYPALP